MGLTNSSTSFGALDSGLEIKRQSPDDVIIALAGNPNVGKSTLFNELTGMNQHTGNWPGKTVTNAQGYCNYKNKSYIFVDIPGTYSLMAHSVEEEVARNYICFGKPDVIVIVCDATCLERNLNLVLQTLEITDKVIVCVNLMDEAKRKKIKINLPLLSKTLGVPVIGTVAREKKSIYTLLNVVDNMTNKRCDISPIKIEYPEVINNAADIITEALSKYTDITISKRWLSLKLLDTDDSLNSEIESLLGKKIISDDYLVDSVEKAKSLLLECGITQDKYRDITVTSIMNIAEEIYQKCVAINSSYLNLDRKIDKILTSKISGYPIMLAMFTIIFWLTITGANYPSKIISSVLFTIQDIIYNALTNTNIPLWITDLALNGIYKVLSWVISVMLPPMAIFFPLFTILEDIGYLPRIAYNLDKPFKKCCACGKQALTMCMGFGCNAAGIVGCRIIDSPRERMLAILTNSFVPCNGRFPTLIAMITMFFISFKAGILSSFMSAVILLSIIMTGIVVTFITTKILSKTILKGIPSSFTLELPPYRRPQLGKVIIRSIFDRTIFVLGRAVSIAAPAGLLIWLMANISVNGISLLNHCANFLNPFAKLMGFDGVILMSFILGFPANEIVIPIMLMAYMSQGSLTEASSIMEMKNIFIQNGWNMLTALNVMLFSLFHWPCSTTILTIKKETGSIKWTVLSVILPTLIGILLCMLTNLVYRLL